MEVDVQRVSTTDPLRTALVVMGRTARQASRSWTLQEHAGRLAALAGPRDYIGQLRAVYDDFVRRWRYTMEPGERVPGSARALLGYVLGAAYNQSASCPDPERCDLAATSWRSLGFGDCDDAATYIAGAALALGMEPVFRVVQWPGGAHVSALVRTPRGERVSVDPVGHPEHEFGWAATPPGGRVIEFDLNGNGGQAMGALALSGPAGTMTRTWFDGPRRGIRVATTRPHVVLTAKNDDRGARVLAMPLWAQRIFKRGLVVPRARAYSQFGELYEYVAGLDAWAPVDGAPRLAPTPLSGRAERVAKRRARRAARRERRAGRKVKRKARRAVRRKKVKAFFAKVRKGIARVFRKISQSKIATFFRKLKTKFLRSPLVQQAIGTVLSAFGVPKKAVQAVMEREASLAEQGGRSKLAALVAEGKWGEAAKMVGKSFVDAGKAVVKGLIPGAKGLISKIPGMSGYRFEPMGLSGFEGMALAGLPESVGCRYAMQQNGRSYYVAPVMAMTGVPGVYLAGQLEVSETPESGRWYRIQPGDTLFGVVSAAYGVGPGGKRLKIAKWVNASAANQCLHSSDIPDGELQWWASRISFMPRFSCSREDQERCTAGDCLGIVWLPPAEGVEPPELPDDEPLPEPVDPEPEPDDPEPDDPEPEDVEPEEPPPAPPEDDDDDEPDVPEDVPDEPEPEPVDPPAPPDDDDPEPVDPAPEPPVDDPDDDDQDDDVDPAPPPIADNGRGRKIAGGILLALALAAGARQ